MTSPLSGSLAKTVGKAFKGLFLDAVLTRETPGDGPPYDPGPSTTTPYPCKGIHEEWGASYLAGGLVLAGERKVLILAASLLTEPEPGDRITIRGETFTVAPKGRGGQPPVSTDPARAVWVLRAST